MTENDKDQTFIPGKDEPPIVACLMHPTKRSVKQFIVDVTTDFAGVRYGLCSYCTRRLRTYPSYQNKIRKEIDYRLEQLKKEKENANKV